MLLRVLVIDDHPAILQHVSTWVSASAVAEVVGTASLPDEAMALFEALRPDVTLCDMHMPHVDGFDLCRRLRTHNADAAVVLFSARDDAVLRAAATAAGAAGLVSKTASPIELAAALRAAVQEP